MTINMWTSNNKNFGDAVNKRFWSKLTGKKIIFQPNKSHYITTGSIMNRVKPNSIIFGTGFISKKGDLGGNNFNSINNKLYCKPKKVIAVRGPETRKKLLKFGIECPENYGDPLLLMPCIYNKKEIINDNIIGIIPHYVDKKNPNFVLLVKKLRKSGFEVKFIDIQVKDKYENLIDQINSCKYIISSSLHGIMMGIVYQKETIFIEFSSRVIGKTFKFNDFFGSLAINYENINAYDESVLDNVISVDYDILVDVGLKLISLIPFINDNEKKKKLQEKYQGFYK